MSGKKLAKLVLTDALLMGVDIIDDQHKALFELFNTLIDRLERPLPEAGEADIVGRLFDYARFHFAEEERVMEACGFPKRRAHGRQHDAFVLNLKDVTVGGDDRKSMGELVQFLAHWIQQHILIADREVACHISRQEPKEEAGAGLAAEVKHFLGADPAAARADAVKRELTQHRMWLAGKSTRRGDFDFRDLSELSLDDADLSSASLTGANLARTSLRGARLANTSLIGADLEEADLSDADLTGADLRGANLHRALLTAATLRGADLCSRIMTGVATDIETAPTVLTEAKLERAVLCNARLVGCDFTGADMAEADLAGADLSGAVMIGADLDGVRFDGAVMTGTVIDLAMLEEEAVRAIGAIGGTVEPSLDVMTVEQFVAAVRDHELWAESGGAKGRRLDLDRAGIPAVKMTGRRLAGARMRYCRVAGGTWPEVDLSMADLSHADLRDLVLTRCRARGATFRRANLAGADLAGAVLDALPLASGGRVWPTNFEGANLRAANLTGASLDGVIMRKADLRGCRTEGVSVRNSDFEGARR